MITRLKDLIMVYLKLKPYNNVRSRLFLAGIRVFILVLNKQHNFLFKKSLHADKYLGDSKVLLVCWRVTNKLKVAPKANHRADAAHFSQDLCFSAASSACTTACLCGVAALFSASYFWKRRFRGPLSSCTSEQWSDYMKNKWFNKCSEPWKENTHVWDGK